MPTFVTRDGMTIEINPIPKGKLGVRKRPEGGVLQCQRCGRDWEADGVLQRYTDLCPQCVPVVLHICGESRRIPNPQFLAEDESVDSWLASRS